MSNQGGAPHVSGGATDLLHAPGGAIIYKSLLLLTKRANGISISIFALSRGSIAGMQEREHLHTY